MLTFISFLLSGQHRGQVAASASCRCPWTTLHSSPSALERLPVLGWGFGPAPSLYPHRCYWATRYYVSFLSDVSCTSKQQPKTVEQPHYTDRVAAASRELPSPNSYLFIHPRPRLHDLFFFILGQISHLNTWWCVTHICWNGLHTHTRIHMHAKNVDTWWCAHEVISLMEFLLK